MPQLNLDLSGGLIKNVGIIKGIDLSFNNVNLQTLNNISVVDFSQGYTIVPSPSFVNVVAQTLDMSNNPNTYINLNGNSSSFKIRPDLTNGYTYLESYTPGSSGYGSSNGVRISGSNGNNTILSIDASGFVDVSGILKIGNYFIQSNNSGVLLMDNYNDPFKMSINNANRGLYELDVSGTIYGTLVTGDSVQFNSSNFNYIEAIDMSATNSLTVGNKLYVPNDISAGDISFNRIEGVRIISTDASLSNLNVSGNTILGKLISTDVSLTNLTISSNLYVPNDISAGDISFNKIQGNYVSLTDISAIVGVFSINDTSVNTVTSTATIYSNSFDFVNNGGSGSSSKHALLLGSSQGGLSGTNNQVLLMGNYYDDASTSCYSYIQPVSKGRRNTNLLLNYYGGNIGIGKIPTQALDVSGIINSSRISATDASFTNLTILTNLYAPNDISAGDISFNRLEGSSIKATDASFTNLTVLTNLYAPNDISAGDISFNRLEGSSIKATDASFTNLTVSGIQFASNDISAVDISFNKIQGNYVSLTDISATVGVFSINDTSVNTVTSTATIYSRSFDFINNGTSGSGSKHGLLVGSSEGGSLGNNNQVLLMGNYYNDASTSCYSYIQPVSKGRRNTNLLLNYYGGNIGIGKVPTQALDVSGVINGSRITATDASFTNLTVSGIQFASNDISAVDISCSIIQASTKIGIGLPALSTMDITSASTPYTTIEQSPNSMILRTGNSTNDQTMYFGVYKDALPANNYSYIQSSIWGVNVNPLLINRRGGNVIIGSGASNVGIGKTPTQALDVLGTTNTDKLISVDASFTNITVSGIIYAPNDISAGDISFNRIQGSRIIATDASLTNLTVSGIQFATNDISAVDVSCSNIQISNRLGVALGAGVFPATNIVVGSSANSKDGLAVKFSDVYTVISNENSTNAGVIQTYNNGTATDISTSTYTLKIQPVGGSLVLGNASSTITVPGTISKGGGTFDIEHPLDSSKRLVHSFIEGPRCDLIYRGTVKLINGFAIVNIDKDCVQDSECSMSEGTFEVLCTNPVKYLHNNDSFSRVRGSISGNKLTIICEDSNSSDNIDWMVVAERKDRFIKNWNRTNDNGFLKTEYLKTD